MAWQLRWRGDGAFVEQLKGPRLSFRWGFDGGAAGTTWEVQWAHAFMTSVLIIHYRFIQCTAAPVYQQKLARALQHSEMSSEKNE